MERTVMATWFPIFRENAFVSWVKRRIDIPHRQVVARST
jgi:hypothetical protein